MEASPPTDPTGPPQPAEPARAELRWAGLAAGISVAVVPAYLGGGWTGAYVAVVVGYVLARIALSLSYRPPAEAGIAPTVSVVVPAYNEGRTVARTVHACMALDYPEGRLDVVCINDGSTDDTWHHMRAAADCYPAGSVQCIDAGHNRGKRAALATGIRATTGDIVVVVDSDSAPAPGAVRRLVQSFADPGVAAVSGLTHVRNADATVLTRMQAVQYYVSFQVLKSAESVLGAVSCCAGCFSAYRRSALADVLGPWEHQRFLGRPRVHGDDRALTNALLRRGWATRYDCRAEAWTDVPERYGEFFRQQLRWKKSWALESPSLLSHLWRTRPAAFLLELVATTVGVAGPALLAWHAVAAPLSAAVALQLLSLGLVLPAASVARRAAHTGVRWRYALATAVFYTACSGQLYWAILRLRDGCWGTRRAARRP